MVNVLILPTLQAAISKTLTQPSLDNMLTISQIYAFHAQRSPNHPIFTYAEALTDFSSTIYYLEVYTAIQRGHNIVTHKRNELSQGCERNNVVGVLASLGSTTQPKPVPILNSHFMNWGLLEIDIYIIVIAVHLLPIFHESFHNIYQQTVIACFRPANSLILLIPDIFLWEIIVIKSQIVYCIPIFIEVHSHSPENIPILYNLSVLIYDGAPLICSIGEQLITVGVKLLTVEKINNFTPMYSRIFKKMSIKQSMLLTMNEDVFVIDDSVCLNTYEKEINALYDAVKDSSQMDIPIPDVWTSENTMSFVTSTVRRVIRDPLTKDQNIFQQGCDSLQAMWIRNSLLYAIWSSKNKANIYCVSSNFVYVHPSIQQLGNYFWMILIGIANMHEQNCAVQIEPRSLVTKNIVKILTLAWTIFPASVDLATVLLTDSTGHLSCHILKQLMECSDVVKVYALNYLSAMGERVTISWLSVDDAAKTIVDLLKILPTALPSCIYINLVHPSPVAWNKLFEVAVESFYIDFIVYENWLKKLQLHRENPAGDLAEISDNLMESFFQDKLGDGLFMMDQTLELCPTLRILKSLGLTDILKYLAFWKF
ncbi:hypothetical protein AN958_11866 [Leucoagaricus sp. SymC.cos]|nr:hypothetical protein AN958_11866 [Leucoagaricus sp. SymC.cos]